MIKMCFLDTSNNSMIVNAFKQLINRRNCEELFMDIPNTGTFQCAVCFTVSGSPQKAECKHMGMSWVHVLLFAHISNNMTYKLTHLQFQLICS